MYPSYFGGRDWHDSGSRASWQKVNKTSFQQTRRMWRCPSAISASAIPATWETVGMRTVVQAKVNKRNETLSENKLKQKRAGDVMQMIECLPSKCEALGWVQIPVPPKIYASFTSLNFAVFFTVYKKYFFSGYCFYLGFFYCFILFLQCWELNLGPQPYLASTLPLSYILSSTRTIS
jgi:hypothetical protein